MDTLRETQKKYCSQAIYLAIFSTLVCIAIEQVAIGKGLILGTLFSILNFILIGETIPHKIGKSEGKTFFISLGSIVLRLALLAIPIIVGIKLDEVNLYSTVIGIFSVQIVLMADTLFTVIVSKFKK